MKKNAKKSLAQLAQKMNKNQVIDQSMKGALKGGNVVVEDGIMM